MIKKPKSIIDKLYPVSFLLLIVVLWQLLLSSGMVEAFIMPSPLSVIKAFINDFGLLMKYSIYTIFEGLSGLFASIILGYTMATLMDRFVFIKKALYPVLVLSQTIPVIAIAPLLVLWFGYDMTPKIVLVILTCFFPIAIGIFDGICNIESDYINELRVLGGKYFEGLFYVKIPLTLPSFFSTLKIATTYAVVGAVVAEWIGGTMGLGVYMTRVRKSYEFDKMFAVIFLIVIISLILISVVKVIERKVLKDV